MIIRFLKDCKTRREVECRCGDGCCSWTEWEDDWFEAGDEEDALEPNRNIDLWVLEAGVDFEIIEN